MVTEFSSLSSTGKVVFQPQRYRDGISRRPKLMEQDGSGNRVAERVIIPKVQRTDFTETMKLMETKCQSETTASRIHLSGL